VSRKTADSQRLFRCPSNRGVRRHPPDLPGRDESRMGADRQITINEGDRMLIRAKARKLVGTHGYTTSDRADIEQELALHLVHQMDKFDSTRSRWNTFVDRIVDRRIISILRHRLAQRRDYRRTVPFDQPMADQNGERLEPVDRRRARVNRSSDLAIDLSDVIECLDRDTRHMFGLLMHESIAETARRLGLTRAEARTRVARIRKLLTDSGLEVYLED